MSLSISLVFSLKCQLHASKLSILWKNPKKALHNSPINHFFLFFAFVHCFVYLSIFCFLFFIHSWITIEMFLADSISGPSRSAWSGEWICFSWSGYCWLATWSDWTWSTVGLANHCRAVAKAEKDLFLMPLPGTDPYSRV